MPSTIVRGAPRIDRWLIPSLLALVTFVAFLPALRNGFVNWDDDVNFLTNPYYRGLGANQLRWMFTAFHSGHYIPLTWLTLGFDYIVWGMDPAGYHLTSLLVHVGTAVVFYFVAVRLLGAASPPAGDQGSAVRLGGVFAALFFAVHPLRVESVVWLSERRDVLSGFFYLLTILAYLRACEAAGSDGAARSRWYWGSFGLFALALLAKIMVISLPAVLLLLDVYPLRRLESERDGWLGSTAQRILTEKAPFVLLSLGASLAHFIALKQHELITPVAEVSVIDRIVISAYSLAFYLWKTAVPVNLSPLYEMPEHVDPRTWPFLLSGAAVIAITGAAMILRRRRPALLAVWIAYVVIQLPVIGIIKSGPQLVADRYTYLPFLGWALLAGAGLQYVWRALRRRFARDLAAVPILVFATVLVAGLGLLTWKQSEIWQDSNRLWIHALSIEPSSFAHSNLGTDLLTRGKVTEAIEHYRKAVELRPGFAPHHFNLGVALDRQGKSAEAVDEYREALRLELSDAEAAHYNLGLSLTRLGRVEDAAIEFREALRLKPNDAETYYYLGLSLARMGELSQAIEQYREALRLKPGHAEAHHYLGVALARLGRLSEAVEHYREAVRIKPGDAEAHSNLGVALAAGGGAVRGRRALSPGVAIQS